MTSKSKTGIATRNEVGFVPSGFTAQTARLCATAIGVKIWQRLSDNNRADAMRTWQREKAEAEAKKAEAEAEKG